MATDKTPSAVSCVSRGMCAPWMHYIIISLVIKLALKRISVAEIKVS